jgi:PEP-CTERM motif-containing protein
MKKALIAVATAALILGTAGSASALQTVTVGDYTLDDTSFGAQFGVHFDNASNDVTSAIATVNQDNSKVTFSSTDPFDTDTGGEAVVADGSGGNADPFDNLSVVFEHSWDKVTFSFDGGDSSLMTLVVNGTTVFDSGNCSFCVIENGQTKFTITGNVTAISTLDFTFSPEVGSGRQFRVMGVDDNNPGGGVPEPATWAMMILGFGGVGGLMRRRRETMALAK